MINLKGRNFLKLLDFTPEEMQYLLDLAADFKAKKKAGWLTRFAYVLERNKDVLILGLPTWDPQSDWAQAKLAFFSENLTGGDRYALEQMMKYADKSFLTHQHGVAVAVFQIYDIWSDFN